MKIRGVTATYRGSSVGRDANGYPYAAILYHLTDGVSSSEVHIDEALLDSDDPTEGYFITVAELSPHISAIKDATDMRNNMSRYPA